MTTTDTSTEDLLWKAIGASPSDSLPRLVLADWYDENARSVLCPACGGDGWAWSCKVCGCRPDPEGWAEHSRGCYTQSADGGGSEAFDDDDKCKTCSGAGRVPNGFADLAAALRATADRVPKWFVHYEVCSWDSEPPHANEYSVGPELWAAMGKTQHRYWQDSRTAEAAIRQLCRVWIEVQKK